LEHALILAVMSCFPAKQHPWLIMDRGYARIGLLMKLGLEGIPFLVRAQKNVLVYRKGKPIALGRLSETPGQIQCYSIRYRSKEKEPLDLIIFYGRSGGQILRACCSKLNLKIIRVIKNWLEGVAKRKFPQKPAEKELKLIDVMEPAKEFGVSTEAVLWRLVNLKRLNKSLVNKVLMGPEFRNLDHINRQGLYEEYQPSKLLDHKRRNHILPM
jgi:hypothetical protein